jgi:hypothetical protein
VHVADAMRVVVCAGALFMLLSKSLLVSHR